MKSIQARPSHAFDTDQATPIQKFQSLLAVMCLGILAPPSTGCRVLNVEGVRTTTTDTSASEASLFASGVRRARFIMRQSSGPPTEGSFDAPVSPYTGFTAATRAFLPDGTYASSTSDPNWPAWVSEVGVRISGVGNLNATNTACAIFATAVENTVPNCDLDNAAGLDDICGVGQGWYRVSERDCNALAATLNPGTGAADDGIAIRVVLDRTQLGTAENLRVTLKYIASAPVMGPKSILDCFNPGTDTTLRLDETDPDCSPLSYKVFLKSSASATPQPFLRIIPPINSLFQITAAGQPGRMPAQVNQKSFVVPLATNSSVTQIQISRDGGIANDGAYTTSGYKQACTGSNAVLCHGVTFFEIILERL